MTQLPDLTAPSFTSQTIISLLWPCSVNSTFKKYKGSHLSEEYRAWRDAAGLMLKSQKPRPINGRVSVTMVVCLPDNRVRDGDNQHPIL